MQNSQHGVGLAATEGRLELDNGLTTLPCEPLGYLGKEKVHSFRDKGAVVEGNGILVLAARLARIDGRDVGGELGLLERAFQNILVGNGDLSPRFHGHSLP